MRHRRRHTFLILVAELCFLSMSPIFVLAEQRTSGSRNSIATVIEDEPVIQSAAELLAAVQQEDEEKPHISYEIYSPDKSPAETATAEATTASPLGNCPPQKPNILLAPLSCPRRPRQPECEVHTDCPHTYLCCNHGCTKKCTRLREHDGAAEPETVHPTLACAQLNCSRLGRVCVRRQSVRGVTRSFCVHALYAKRPCDAPESRCQPGDTCQTGRSCNIWGECKYMAVCVVTGDD